MNYSRRCTIGISETRIAAGSWHSDRICCEDASGWEEDTEKRRLGVQFLVSWEATGKGVKRSGIRPSMQST